MTIREKMTNDQKIYFIYGYAYRLAQEAKQEGLFNELTTDELTMVMLNDFINNKRSMPKF
ncbi:gp99 [Bacillus phage W.Ph.]|uniref:Gp99 n=1 Tax=Bacillus phage W.Ph. TaxID=764595 RepID=G9B1K0_9CAUD|nr:gp99 [Bacillus phage W.Ph.]ADH03245.1 gp99 [Bacillus phage W.Ph.]